CRYVRRSVGVGPPEPEDVTQAAFMKFAAIEDRAEIQNPRAFLYATARNIVLDHRRHAVTANSYAKDVEQRIEQENRCESSPERVLLDRERLERLLAYLDKMPEERRQAVLLYRVEGMSVEEIAAIFGISESTARKRIVRAIADCLAHVEDPAEAEVSA